MRACSLPSQLRAYLTPKSDKRAAPSHSGYDSRLLGACSLPNGAEKPHAGSAHSPSGGSCRASSGRSTPDPGPWDENEEAAGLEEPERLLFEAVGRNDWEQVEWLVAAGTDVNAADPEQRGATPLHLAARAGWAECVEILLECGVDPSVLNSEGETPLSVSLLLNPGSSRHTRVRRALVDAGADVNAPLPREFLVKHMLPPSWSLDPGSAPSGHTLLHVAAYWGDAQMVCALAGLEADCEARASSGTTPLMVAAEGNKIDSVAELLILGAKLEAADCEGRTALHYAVGAGSADATRSLVVHGANIHARALINGAYKTPLAMALNAAGGSAEPACIETMQMVAAVTAASSDVLNKPLGIEHLPGYTALHYAARAGQAEVAALLLRAGTNLEVEAGSGETPLMVAAFNGQVKVVRLLLSAGASVHATGWIPTSISELGVISGATPLHCAVSFFGTGRLDGPRNVWGKAEVAKLLLAAGAELWAETEEQLTALDIAATDMHFYQGYPSFTAPTEVLQVLQAAAASWDARGPN